MGESMNTALCRIEDVEKGGISYDEVLTRTCSMLDSDGTIPGAMRNMHAYRLCNVNGQPLPPYGMVHAGETVHLHSRKGDNNSSSNVFDPNTTDRRAVRKRIDEEVPSTSNCFITYGEDIFLELPAYTIGSELDILNWTCDALGLLPLRFEVVRNKDDNYMLKDAFPPFVTYDRPPSPVVEAADSQQQPPIQYSDGDDMLVSVRDGVSWQTIRLDYGTNMPTRSAAMREGCKLLMLKESDYEIDWSDFSMAIPGEIITLKRKQNNVNVSSSAWSVASGGDDSSTRIHVAQIPNYGITLLQIGAGPTGMSDQHLRRAIAEQIGVSDDSFILHMNTFPMTKPWWSPGDIALFVKKQKND
jgi:hypothetical protein